MNLSIPFHLRKNKLDLHGLAGEQWLNNLPHLLKHYEKEWQYKTGDCFSDASFNYVAPARLFDGSTAVLKCGIDSEDFGNEVAALQHFNPKGAVKLIQVDKVKSIMLLEYIEVSGFDKQRLMGWKFVKTVLAACWSYEDNGEIWQPFLDCAQAILDYK